MNVLLIIFLLFFAFATLTSASSESSCSISEEVKNEASKIPTLYEIAGSFLMDQLSLTSDYTVVLQILELNMNVPSFPDGSNILHFASKRLLIDLIRVAIDSEQFDINAVDSADKKCTALLHACYGTKNHEMDGDAAKEAVKLLLSVEGINVNVIDESGYTSLIIASRHGHSEVVKLLLGDERINVNAKDNQGYTLNLASENGHSEVVKMLLGVDHGFSLVSFFILLIYFVYLIQYRT